MHITFTKLSMKTRDIRMMTLISISW